MMPTIHPSSSTRSLSSPPTPLDPAAAPARRLYTAGGALSSSTGDSQAEDEAQLEAEEKEKRERFARSGRTGDSSCARGETGPGAEAVRLKGGGGGASMVVYGAAAAAEAAAGEVAKLSSSSASSGMSSGIAGPSRRGSCGGTASSTRKRRRDSGEMS